MSRMPILPKWALPPTMPSAYEFESATALEMTAKVYGAMSQMIKDYNTFADEINEEIRSFTGSSSEEIQNFKKSIEQRLICEFNKMDAAFAKMKTDTVKYADGKISEIYEQYLDGQITQVINQKIAAGEIDITLVYDPETESLNMTTEEV